MGRGGRKTTTAIKEAKGSSEHMSKASRAIKRVPRPTKKTALHQKFNIRIEAHRGSNRSFHENTIKAFQHAVDLDVDGIELDVWLSSDKVPVIVHGHTEHGLLNAGDFKQNIQETSASDLQALKLADGTPLVPTLADVFEMITKGDKTCSVNIELKGEDLELVDKVVELAAKYKVFDRIFLSSFHYPFREALEKSLKKRKVKHPLFFGYLAWKKEEYPDFSKLIIKKNDIFTLDACLLTKEAEATKNVIEQARKHGLRIGFYFPFEYDEGDKDYQALMEIGADCIITNDVAKVSKFLEPRSKNVVASYHDSKRRSKPSLKLKATR